MPFTQLFIFRMVEFEVPVRAIELYERLCDVGEVNKKHTFYYCIQTNCAHN